MNLQSFQEQSSFSHCTFQGNTAIVPATASIPFGDANGGALATDIFGGTLDVSGTTFIANQAVGGPGGGFVPHRRRDLSNWAERAEFFEHPAREQHC